MSEERMVQHGLVSKLRVRYELCSAEAEVQKDIIWVPESLAARQNKILGDFERFQEELQKYRPQRTSLPLYEKLGASHGQR